MKHYAAAAKGLLLYQPMRTGCTLQALWVTYGKPLHAPCTNTPHCVGCYLLQWWQVPEERRVLMMAMAMQESRHMDVEERDRVKDRQCPDNDLACNEFKDNATIFNLSKVREAWLLARTACLAGALGRQ